MFSLRTALAVIILLVALPGLALRLDSAIQSRGEALDRTTRSAQQLLTSAVADHEALLENTERLLHRVALEIQLGPGTAQCARDLAEHLELYPHYTNLGVGDLHGDVFCSAIEPAGPVNIADRPYFRQALESGAFAPGEFQVGRFTGVPGLNFGYPVLDDAGKPQAVLYAALSLEWLRRRVERAELPPEADLQLLDAAGRSLAHFPHNGRAPSPAPPEGESLTFSAELPPHGDRALKLRINIPKAVLFAHINRRFAREVGLIAAMSLLVLFGGYHGARLLVLRRVDRLVEAAEALGRGDLGRRLGPEPARDELGRLARSFDAMAESIQIQQQRFARVNRALKTLSAGNRALLRAVDEKHLLQGICTALVDQGGYAAAWVGYRQDPEAETLHPMTWAGAPRVPGINRLPRLEESALPQRPRLVLADHPMDCCPDFSLDLGEAGYRSALVLPLRVENTIIGALSVYSREVDAFDAEEQDLLAKTVDDLAFGIDLNRQRARHRKAEAMINNLSRYEQLTGLPNRTYFRERLHETLSAEVDPSRCTAILLVDINRFREINTTLGYDHGDAVLREVSARLLGQLETTGFLAHMGEDEFAVLLPGAGREEAIAVAERFRRALEAPIRLGELSLDVSVSTGIALYPRHGTAPDILVRRADSAMYKAKRAGRDYDLYSAAQDRSSPRHLTMAAELRQAIDHGELKLACQPKLALSGGVICGAEALARWHHPRAGEISPAEFIPLAEHTGLIKPLTRWVLDQALRHARAWAQEGLQVPLAVNLSARNLQERGIVDDLREALDSAGVRPDQLAIELTESALMTDPAGALEIMRSLHDMGIALFIDDFGTGYSSLAYLQRLPVDAIKIDKSFVLAMRTERDSARIVQSTIELAHGLGMEVVAEGVEDSRTMDELARLGCDVVQGYGISRPLPAGQLRRWIEQSPWTLRPLEPNRARRRAPQ